MKPTVELSEIRQQSDDELRTRATRLRSELFRFRLQQQTNTLENTTRPSLTRRELARVLTVLKERVSAKGKA